MSLLLSLEQYFLSSLPPHFQSSYTPRNTYCLTIFPYEGEAQLEHLAGIAVCMAWTEAGQEPLWHVGNWGVDVDGGEHPKALTQQAVEHQQGHGWLCRVGVYDDVTESTEVLVTKTR